MLARNVYRYPEKEGTNKEERGRIQKRISLCNVDSVGVERIVYPRVTLCKIASKMHAI